MKKLLNVFVLIALFTSVMWGCQNSAKSEKENADEQTELTEKPTREPYAGFVWEKVSGAGIEFWAQRSDSMQVGISETLPGAFIEKIENGKPVAIEDAIQIFELKNQKIEDVFEFLKGYEAWDESAACAFSEVPSNREGVTRYVLMPTGKALEEYEKQSKDEPVLSTCAGFGGGNSGTRYFEIHQSNPNRAIFVQIGQEKPLFDETTIVVK